MSVESDPELDLEKVQDRLRLNEEWRDKIINTAERDGGIYTIEDIEHLRRVEPAIARARELLGMEPAQDPRPEPILTLEP